MEELHATRRTLAAALAEIGFGRGPPAPARQPQQEQPQPQPQQQPPGASTNLVRALLCAGLYPNLVRVRMPDTKFETTHAGAVESANEEARAPGPCCPLLPLPLPTPPSE